MWIFMPLGLLMPAALPTKEIDGVEVDPKWTHDGLFNLQVRGRVESHLQNFIRDYMDPMGLEHSQIQATPRMDYNFRFYCRNDDFAQAMGQAVMEIDYQKFKPTAERRSKDGYLLYEDGKAFHSVLNSLWGTITRLNAPWGGRSYFDDEPRRRSTDRAGFVKRTRWDDEDEGSFIGRSQIDSDMSADERATELLERLEGIPSAQWSQHATVEELAELDEFLDANPSYRGESPEN